MFKFGQIIYTSFFGVGFRLLKSPQVTPAIEQAFLAQVVQTHWDQYKPLQREYRSVYCYHWGGTESLFGWLYNDGKDEYGRDNIPYFLSHYLSGELDRLSLERIFGFLAQGPSSLPSRASLPAALLDLCAPDSWSYEAQRPGVSVGTTVREHSYQNLAQKQPVSFFVPAEESSAMDEVTHQRLVLLLAQQIGPFARWLVAELVEQSTEISGSKARAAWLIEALANELPNAAEVPAFRKKIERLLGLEGEKT